MFMTLNNFAYANGNPVTLTDPFGNCAEMGHTALDILGMVPVVGFLFDTANSIWYLTEHDWRNAALSGISLIPVIGEVCAGGKAVFQSIKYIDKAANFADDVADAEKIVKDVERADDCVDALKSLDKANDCAEAAAKGTEELVKDGAKATEEIAKGSADVVEDIAKSGEEVAEDLAKGAEAASKTEAKVVAEGAGKVPNKVTDLAKDMKDWLGKDARVITNEDRG